MRKCPFEPEEEQLLKNCLATVDESQLVRFQAGRDELVERHKVALYRCSVLLALLFLAFGLLLISGSSLYAHHSKWWWLGCIVGVGGLTSIFLSFIRATSKVDDLERRISQIDGIISGVRVNFIYSHN